MRRKSYFKDLDFNKEWAEGDWEKFFQLQDEYLTRTLDPTFILRLRSRSVRPINLDRALSEMGLQSDIPVVKELQRRNSRESDPTHDPLENPIHVSKEGASLENLPIFTEACTFAENVSQTLERFRNRKAKRTARVFRTDKTGECGALKLHACWAALNVAMGQKIGYDPDSIRGNIAKCKRALKHADACIGLMNQLARCSRSSLLRRDLFSKSIRLRNNVSGWIDVLREKFDTRVHP